VSAVKDDVLTMLKEFLTLDVQGDEWDETPWLALVVRDNDGKVVLERMPVEEQMWSIAPVYRVVQAIADTTRSFTEKGWMWSEDAGRLLGVVLFSEGWGISVSATGDEMKSVQNYMESGGMLANHPLGIECKMVTAVLATGEWAMTTYFRNGETVDNEYQGGPEGRVPEALHELLEAFVGGKVQLSEENE
jgi:hypothetical protein